MGECFMFGRGTIQPWAPDSTFANNDWKAIIKAVQNGVVPDTWAVGDQKAMTINGTEYMIDIIGKDHDEYADGSGTAPLTFQMHDCYGTAYSMNSSNTNSGGWTSCAMRITHLPAILALMPSEVQAAIREVNKKTSAGGYSSTIITTADKLFLLSEYEIFGANGYSYSGEGSRYAYYANTSNSKVKKRNGSAAEWYTRSPDKNSSSGYVFVNTSGSYGAYPASYTLCAAHAFCF